MADYRESLRKAAFRNGRECAEAAVLAMPPPWDEHQADRILDSLATALVETFPGGPSMFLPFAGDVTDAAKAGFNERLAEIEHRMPTVIAVENYWS